MNEVTIQRVDASTVPTLIALLCRLAEYERLEPPDAEAQTRLGSDLLGAEPPFEAYLAFLSGVPVGCITLLRTYSTFAARPVLYLEDLFVEEPHRHQGMGQQLFDFCVALAKERGCARLEWNVLNWNAPAMRFYEKKGATAVRDWTWYRLELG